MEAGEAYAIDIAIGEQSRPASKDWPKALPSGLGSGIEGFLVDLGISIEDVDVEHLGRVALLRFFLVTSHDGCWDL